MLRYVVCLFASIPALASAGAQPAADQPGGVSAFSIDMDTDGNGAMLLGERQSCKEALPGETLTVDVTAVDIPADAPVAAYTFELGFDGPAITITDQQQLMIAAAPGSEAINSSEPLPQFDGSFLLVAADSAEAPEAHEAGSGVLERLTLEVGTDAAPALYDLAIAAASYTDPAGVSYTPGTSNDARLAVGLSCTELSPSTSDEPTGTATSPAGSGTARQSPAPTGTPGASSPTASNDADADGGVGSVALVAIAVSVLAIAIASVVVLRRRL